jgi:hypothetical protein
MYRLGIGPECQYGDKAVRFPDGCGHTSSAEILSTSPSPCPARPALLSAADDTSSRLCPRRGTNRLKATVFSDGLSRQRPYATRSGTIDMINNIEGTYLGRHGP